MKELVEKIENAQRAKFPFVIYKKPHSKMSRGIFQKDGCINYSEKLNENGFVFAPFDDREPTLVIPYNNSEVCLFELDIRENTQLKNDELVIDVNKSEHIDLVQKGINFINNTNADKVVLSRKEEVEIVDFDILNVFENLCDLYPNAFVYLWNHPASGIWMGASPERLLTVKDSKFKVMALASTQNYKGELQVVWREKEREEHQIVVDYIADKLQDFNITVSDTYTVKAGSLLHLRADLEGQLSDSNTSLQPLIRVLHPTPAVCGLPKEESKLFILNNEKYNREYYTGFLGELNNNEADLFVNLRCMKIDLGINLATVYVGGGITKDSDPEKEWLETVAKTNIMKKVLL